MAISVTSRGVTELAQAYYEGMFILDSSKFGADPDGAGKEVIGIIEKVGGTVVTHRPWEDRKLAYQIGKRRKGLYYLTFFTAESTAVNDIRGIVKLNESVVRHMILSHDKGLFDQMVEMLGGGDAFRHVTEDGKPATVKAAAGEVATGDAAAGEVATGETATAEAAPGETAAAPAEEAAADA
jgi:small subunit ribosomal protein S6